MRQSVSRPILAVILAAGCHFGGGPIIARSNGKLRLGVETSGGWGFLRGSAGFTAGPSTGHVRIYGTVDPAVALRVNRPPAEVPYGVIAVGGTLGIAGGPEGTGLVAGGWASGSYIDECKAEQFGLAFSLAIGGRWLDGITEVFAAPKVATVFGCPIPADGH